jgi:KaiC/GvpD/RAD55 family RecA-like ATPase
MYRILVDVERFDDVGGGAPPDSVVHLVGEGGAGAREFSTQAQR